MSKIYLQKRQKYIFQNVKNVKNIFPKNPKKYQRKMNQAKDNQKIDPAWHSINFLSWITLNFIPNTKTTFKSCPCNDTSCRA